MFSLAILSIMTLYYLYKTYWKVVMGPLYQQIELNKQTKFLQEAQNKTEWNKLLSHTADSKEVITTCKNGCCKFFGNYEEK
jgi:hypothetical protein